VAVSFRWLIAAPGAAAVKVGRRPPPEAARSGLDGGEAGAGFLIGTFRYAS